MNLSVFRYLLLLTLLLILPPATFAIDPRFELDTSKLAGGKKQESMAKKPAARRYRQRNSAMLLQKLPDNQDSASRTEQPATTIPPVELQKIRSFWGAMVPGTGQEELKPLVFSSANFSLSIDPARYPRFKTLDDAVLLLDTDNSLPPLVKSLISERDPSIRIVTAAGNSRRQFLGELLKGGGFYSVEEYPVMSFGTDPQLKIRFDYKVERTDESVMKNELVLVNADQQGLPVRLNEYLQKQGFRLYEPFATGGAAPLPPRHTVIHSFNDRQGDMVDHLLSWLSLPVEKNRRLELFTPAENGISLSVSAERYFVYKGERFVINHFNGDPVTYTLFRLLETKGYRVITLDSGDSFRPLADKLLSRLGLSSGYMPHLLATDPSGRYSLELSGFMLENFSKGGGALLLTDLPIEKELQGILYDHGYKVQKR